MRIKLTDPRVFKKQPFTVPFKAQDALKNEIDRLKGLGLITESKGLYACPAFAIMKKSGKIRLIVDYRPINKVTVPDNFPFPNMHDEIRSIPQSHWFSQIDLSMGYHQIELEGEDRKYTSFITPFGQYEYTRVPFGLMNAPGYSNV